MSMRKRSVVGRIVIVSIGINYFKTDAQLQGCINDSNNFLTFARTYYGAHLGKVIQMVDTLPPTDLLYPTHANITRVLKAVVSEPMTHLWLHYSGHGTQIRDKDKDEVDRLDEALVPVDYKSAGMLVDDWFLSDIIHALPASVSFFGLIDACHSATMMDLRYTIKTQARLAQTLTNKRCKERPNVIMISGCMDNSVSYDIYDNEYGASGAMTVAFLRSAIRNRHAPALTVVLQMQRELKTKRYNQVPQLTMAGKITINTLIPGIGDF
jgi:hypothetical protein